MYKVLFVVGPTAAGKTEYAIRAAEAFGGEIVSADSVQLYRRLDVGSAKPTAKEQARAIHHLIDTVDPMMPFSVAEYAPKAKAEIEGIATRGLLPIVSGGTGLYVNSLLYKMDFGGSAEDNTVRKRLEREAAENGGNVLYERLEKEAPEAALRIEKGNVRKVIRALELLETTGSALADFNTSFVPTEDYKPVLICLTREREELISRIERRVELMFEEGLENEVRSLLSEGLTADSQSMQAIGYKEIIDAIEGRLTDIHDDPIPADTSEAIERAKELIKVHTRQYAKRQMTWFKRLPGIVFWNLSDNASADDFLEYCEKRLAE